MKHTISNTIFPWLKVWLWMNAWFELTHDWRSGVRSQICFENNIQNQAWPEFLFFFFFFFFIALSVLYIWPELMAGWQSVRVKITPKPSIKEIWYIYFENFILPFTYCWTLAIQARLSITLSSGNNRLHFELLLCNKTIIFWGV